MIKQIYKRQIWIVNVVVFTALFFLLLINKYFNIYFFRFIQIPAGLIFIFIISANIACLIQYFLKKRLEIWEFLSVSSIFPLIFFPFLLTFEFILFDKVNAWMPFVNGLLTFLTVLFFSFFDRNDLIDYPKFNFLDIKKALNSYFFLFFSLSFSFFLILVASYQPLPDLDPYKWMFNYNALFEQNYLTSLSARPLFSSLTYTFINIIGTSIFTFFKYILPLSFLLIFPSLWLVARNLPSLRHKTILWMFILASPSTLLYLVTPMPQLPIIIITIHFILTLYYSYQQKNQFFYFFSGAVIASSFFYHQIAALILLPWILVTIVTERKRLLTNKMTSLLLVIIILSNYPHLDKIFKLLMSWVLLVYNKLKFCDLNILFPAYYTNIDNISVGWSGAVGVLKFYAYYAGPLIISGLFFMFFMLIKNKGLRVFFLKKILINRELTIFLLVFLIFFAISDIFPRFPNLAFLPDRAWIFSGIFFIPLAILLLSYFEEIPKKIYFLTICLFAIGLSGTLYVNYLKKYLITPDQIKSAEWIKNKLPEKRLMISSGHNNLLHYHANSDFIETSPDIYCNNNLPIDSLNDDGIINKYLNSTSSEMFRIDDFFNNYIVSINKNVSSNIEIYKNAENTDEKIKVATKLLETNISSSNTLSNFLDTLNPPNKLREEKGLDAVKMNIMKIYNPSPISKNDDRKYFIYYAKEDSKNPYNQRPYSMSNWGKQKCSTENFIFFKYPEHFKEIYNDKNNIIIWEVL